MRLYAGRSEHDEELGPENIENKDGVLLKETQSKFKYSSAKPIVTQPGSFILAPIARM